MANQKRVATSYDSGGANTAKSGSGYNAKGDWGNDTPQKGYKEGNGSLGLVLEDFNNAREYYKGNYQKIHQECWQCYNSMRTRRGYDGIADDFIPETFTIIESIKANIAGGKPKFNFLALREEQEQDTKVLNEMLDFYWKQNHMTKRTLSWVQDSLVLGTGVLHVYWDGDMPRVKNIPLDDFFVDPTATHIDDPSEDGYPDFAGYRYLTTRAALEEAEIIDPETGDMKQLYQNLDGIPDMDLEEDKLDQAAKEMFLGSTLGIKKARKKQVEIIVYYSRKKKILVANRKTVIYEGKNPYQRDASSKEVTVDIAGEMTKTRVKIPRIKPFLPFAILRNYVDTSLFYAKGDVETILPLQEAVNDVSNQKRDNLTYVMNNMWQIDPQFAHLKDQIESIPGAVYPIPKGALAPIEKQVITGEADGEILRLTEAMRRATAADEVVQGVSQDKGRVTATEVQAQLNQASQRFSTKLTTLEDEGYAQLGSMLFKMVQIFVTQEMAIRITGPDGTAWRDFDPNEYSGEYQPEVQLESTTKAVRAEEGQKFAVVHQAYANSPLVNQQELARVYFEKMLDLPEDQIKRILTVQQPSPTQSLLGGMNGAGSPQSPMSSVPAGPLSTPSFNGA